MTHLTFPSFPLISPHFQPSCLIFNPVLPKYCDDLVDFLTQRITEVAGQLCYHTVRSLCFLDHLWEPDPLGDSRNPLLVRSKAASRRTFILLSSPKLPSLSASTSVFPRQTVFATLYPLLRSQIQPQSHFESCQKAYNTAFSETSLRLQNGQRVSRAMEGESQHAAALS